MADAKGRPVSPELEAAYRNTTFRVFRIGAPHIDIRIGFANQDLDVLLGSYGVVSWAFITAWNPASSPLPQAENNKRHVALLATVRDAGWPYLEGEGVPDEVGWFPERSLLTIGMGEEDAVALGQKFGQHAIVVGILGRLACLRWC